MNARGTAMVETAISISAVLLLLFGTVQMAVLGFQQSSADGAAFVAAHTVGAGYQQTSGVAAATKIFSNVSAGDITMGSPGGSTVSSTVTLSNPGLMLLAGPAQPVTVSGGDVEPVVGNIGSSTGNFQYSSANTTLANFCSYSLTLTLGVYVPTLGGCSATQLHIHLAQEIDTVNNGNGANGAYGNSSEWSCHANVYANLANSLPSTRPTPGPSWLPDAVKAVGAEATIYNWDSNPLKQGPSCT